MIPLQDVMPRALEAIIREAPLTPEKVAFAWRTAVGPAMDRVTSAELRDDILYVRARDAAWQREVARSASLICGRLAPLLGESVVRAIEVVGT